MNFLEQSKKGKGGDGTYLLSFAAVFFTTLIAGVFSEVIAVKFFGFSLAGQLPEGKSETVAFVLQLFPFVAALGILLLCVNFHYRN